MINVSRVVHSNHFAQKIKVRRREKVWREGELVLDNSQNLIMYGIVTVANPQDLQMVPEGDRQTGAMKFLVTERLYTTSNRGRISDQIEWRGAWYKITAITPDIDYGFYRAIGTRLEGDGIG